MTLEDFFTLTEMKDGLTAPSRVAELLNVMQKEKDSVAKNVGDATRQWAAVASTIAATENKDCLDLFIQLDGLGFIDRWLKDAQKFGNDTSDSFVEESITALLRALEKLQIDNERSISSGIWITVKNLLGHNSSKVQDRARMLFDSWKQGEDSDSIHQDVVDESRRLAEEDGGRSTLDNRITRGSSNEENHVLEHARDEISQLRRSDDLQPEKIKDAQISDHNDQPGCHITLDHEDTKDGTPDPLASSLSNTLQENPSIKEVSPIRAAEGTTSTGACGVPVTKQCTDEVLSDVLKLSESSKNEKQVLKVDNSSEKLGMTEISSTSGALEFGAACTGDDAAMQRIVREPALQNSVAASERDVCWKTTALGDVRTPTSDFKSGLDDMRVINHCSGNVFKTTGQDSECCSNAVLDLSANGSISGKLEDLDAATFSRNEDTIEADEDMEHTSDDGDDLMNASDFPEPAMDIELECGIVDALEVARQVAQAVEREVVDYREPFCSSSSEKTSEGGIRQLGSPDSIYGKQDLPTDVPQEEVPTGQSHSVETNPEGDGGSINSANLDNGPENSTHDMESSQVTEAAQEPEVNIEKGPCDFDLNREVSSDETDCPVNPSTPISFVAASRPAAAPGFPVAPLQFEGSLGWKGCAVTSAFRPASPRRIPDGDKTLSIGGTNDASKQRHDCLDFDLNVAEGGGDELGKQIPSSSSLPSGESSVEVGPMRSGRLKLDLNCIGDDSDVPMLDSIMGEQLFNNRSNHRSPSPASSSSSMQPFLRNIDLNDRPNIHCDALDHGPSKSSQFVNAYGGPKPDAPVISIMGTRVEVNRKDFRSQTPSLLNGKSTDPTMDASMTRAGGVLGMGPTMSYAHSPVFGNIGLTTGPTMSFSAVYGPAGSIPYMVDSRGAPVVPQIVGSASAVPPAAYPQSAFIMSMSGVQSGINNAGQSRPSFDLNSGFVMEGGGGRDSGSLRQLFIPGQGRSMEEHLRTNLQPSSSSGVGAKRKETDSAWEPYPFNYRHQQPPWK